MRTRVKTVAIFGGSGTAAIAISLVFLYLFSPYGAIPLYVGYQLVPWDVTRYSTQAEKIAVGEIVSLENRVIDDTLTYSDPETGDMISRVETNAYYVVTIQVDRYIVDKSGEYPSSLTFRDHNVEGIFFIDGQKRNIISEYSSEYKVGDRAIFFIERSDYEEKSLASSGVAMMFKINETDGTVQSKYLVETERAPMKLVDFEREVNDALIEKASPAQ